MSEGQIRLGIPGTGATDFAASPIPSLTLDDWVAEGIPTPTPIGYKEIGTRSNNGVAGIIGPAHAILYGWQVVVVTDLDGMLQLGALAKWQKLNQDAGSLAALRLIDECNYLEAEPTPHTKTLLTPLNPSWNAGYSYGYGVFPVQLILSEGWNIPIGVFADGTPAYQLTFGVEEI
jgi:hypothetical protein